MLLVLMGLVIYLIFKFKVQIWKFEIRAWLKIIFSLAMLYIVVNIVCEIWSLIWFWFL